MFSVYGRSGRLWRGRMEEMRQVGPVAHTHPSRAVGQELLEQRVRTPAAPALPSDVAHRNALQAYAQTRNPNLPRQRLRRAAAVMSSPVITVADSFTVEQAWQVLARNHLGQAPVVQATGLPVGLISRADLMAPGRLPEPDSQAAVWRNWLQQRVADVMWTPVPCALVDTDIRRVARVLLDAGLPGLAVTDEDGRVLGFVSRTDILRAVVSDPPLDLWT